MTAERSEWLRRRAADGVQVLRISDAEYHADPAPEPSLSSSLAKVLVEKSARHAWEIHPRLGGRRTEDTACTDRGLLIHRLVLGKGAELAVVDAKDWRTSAAKDARDAARAAGRLPVLAQTHQDAERAATAITANLAAAGIELSGESELSVLWPEHGDEGSIWARCRMDHVIIDRARGVVVILDLKTIHSAHPEQCMRSAINYGYDIQNEAYKNAADAAWPEFAGRVEFLFLFCEAEPPYAVTVAELDGVMRERGRRRWSRACHTWARCLRSGEWPAYAREPVTLFPPGWLLHQEEYGQ